MWVTPRKLPHLTFIGTSAILFAIVNWMKVPAYLALGAFPHEVIVAALLLMPLAIVSTLLTVRWLRRIDGARFYVIIYLLMVALGAKLLWENETDICGLMSAPLFQDGVVYLLDKNRGLQAFELKTGKILWSHPGDRKDIGRGVCMDIDPAHPGAECWASVGPLFNARGEILSESKPRAVNFAVWWDGDLLRESLDRTTIAKWNPAAGRLEPLLEAGPLGAASNNGTKATPVFSADILGDWREEVVWRSADNRELLIASSPHTSPHRLITLMQDRQYRAQVAGQNAGYNQPPHPSFPIGPPP